jgi:hypothetical protein
LLNLIIVKMLLLSSIEATRGNGLSPVENRYGYGV